ncbi:butyrophilin subfamily 1 member A1-like [Paralichthys olivaceus]|uniref:butyrophilin subfamily 1 member A1-like n=1 Tax=Paralichthys olivaceus TaxID=8255 RepID=UPI00375124BE
MGLHMRCVTRMAPLVLLFSSLSTASSVSKSLVVLVRSPVLEPLGGEITLPCWLNPPQSAEALEVRWYQNDRFDTPIIHYQNKEMVADPSYVGRASFALKDAASGGLGAGDVSLKLQNVKIEDVGDYICYVSSDHGYDRGSVSLKVTEMGTSPLLSMAWAEENVVNMSCESEGWYPKPRLHWTDHKHNLTPKSLQYSKVSSGLVSVHSWLLVPSSSEVSCLVGLSDELKDSKEARGRLGVLPQADKQVPGSVPGLVITILVLVALSAVLGGLYIKERVLRKKDKSERSQPEENKKLLQEVEGTSLEEAKKHYVNIELDKRNPNIKIKDCIFRENIDPDGKPVTCLTVIRGTPGFTSGQHYWEVSLEKPGVGIKMSWWVGVTQATDFPLQAEALSSTSNGFWFLSSSPVRAGSLQLNTESKVLLPVSSRLKTVGVYLNYDSGELSFFNVDDESVIVSFITTFHGEVFPFFNPGKGDKGTMEILKRTEQ